MQKSEMQGGGHQDQELKKTKAEEESHRADSPLHSVCSFLRKLKSAVKQVMEKRPADDMQVESVVDCLTEKLDSKRRKQNRVEARVGCCNRPVRTVFVSVCRQRKTNWGEKGNIKG